VRRKRVLLITERYRPEEFLVNEVAVRFAEDLDVTVITQVPSYPYDRVYKGFRNRPLSAAREGGILVYRFVTVLGYKRNVVLKVLNYASFVAWGTLLAVLSGWKCDTIFIYHTGPLTMAFPGVLAGRIYGKRTVIWTQDIWPDSVYAYGLARTRLTDALLARFIRWIYHGCDRILVSCEGFEGRLKSYSGKRPITFCPNWANLEPPQGREIPGWPSGTNFTFAGNVGKVQNLEILLRAFSQVETRIPTAHFHIFGDGSHLEALKHLAASLSLRNVAFWGRKPSSQIADYLARSDVLVLSLTRDPVLSLTVPAKFQAYLSMGKPILSAIDGEVNAMVEKYGLGYACAPDDLEDIVRGFLHLAGCSEDRIAAIRDNSRRLLDEKYNRGKVLATLCESL
jgi:glycosyltransferase involved in cell wall biosynthesis